MLKKTFVSLMAVAATTAGAVAVQAQGTESVPPAYLAPEWRLSVIDGKPFTAVATIDLSKPGQLAGKGPCNRYFGSYEGKLPEFRPKGVASTRMACPEMEAEHLFFTALGGVTYAEVVKAEGKPEVLILSGEKGSYLEFIRPLN